MTERSLHPGGTRKGISMTTFLALDLRIMSGALRGLGIILAVGTLGLAAGNVDFFMPFVTILAVMGVMNLFASIEAGGLTRLFGSLPGTRADAMRAHYLFVLVCAAISFVPWLLGLLVHLAVPRWGGRGRRADRVVDALGRRAHRLGGADSLHRQGGDPPEPCRS